MKVILSRKGFDSGAGGYPSPFFVKEGRLLSLPIPEENKIYTADTGRTYSDLLFDDDTTYFHIMDQLGMKNFTGKNAHLDPDINQNVLKDRKPGWKGLFGQCDAAQQHLCNNHVRPGDLFLFFGWFRDVKEIVGKYKYVSGTDKHIIWGYMQIGEIDSVGQTSIYESWKLDHPHYRNRNRVSNTGYIARESLDFNPEIPGCGVFNYDDSLVLTDPTQRNRTVWRLPKFFHPDYETKMTYHEYIFNSGNKQVWESYDDHCILHSVCKGQEFVITGNDKVVEWAKKTVTQNCIHQNKHIVTKPMTTIDTNFDELYMKAKSVINPHRLSEYAEAGGVGAAILAESGNVYTGVCIDTACSMGFCAEHAAAAAMITAGESRVLRIIAVGSDGRIMPPCGRCREFISQIHNDNLNSKVMVDEGTVVTLRELLPYDWRK